MEMNDIFKAQHMVNYEGKDKGLQVHMISSPWFIFPLYLLISYLQVYFSTFNPSSQRGSEHFSDIWWEWTLGLMAYGHQMLESLS